MTEEITTVTNSERQTFNQCPRKHHYKYTLRRESVDFVPELVFGSAIHAAMEVYWADLDGSLLLKMVAAFDEYLNKHSGQNNVNTLWAKGHAMLTAYYTGYRESDREKWEVLGIEQNVKYKLMDGLDLIGRYDVLLKDRKTGKIYVMDHKTTKSEIEDPGGDYWFALNIAPQPTGYQLALEQELGEEVFIIYNVLRTHTSKGPKMKPGTRKKKDESDDEWAERKALSTETIDEYCERLTEEYLEKPSAYFQRSEIARTAKDKEEWKAEFELNAAQMSHCKVYGVYPKHVTACRNYGRMCSYAMVCSNLESIDNNEVFYTKPHKHMELVEEPKEVSNVPF